MKYQINQFVLLKDDLSERHYVVNRWLRRNYPFRYEENYALENNKVYTVDDLCNYSESSVILAKQIKNLISNKGKKK